MHFRLPQASLVLGALSLFACGGSVLFTPDGDGSTTSGENAAASAGAGGSQSSTATTTATTGTSGQGGMTSGTSTSTATGSATAATTTGSTSTSATSTTTSGTTTGSTAASSSSSSSSGEMNTCSHDKCVSGAALVANCDPCVTQICNADPFCCSSNNGAWDELCQAAVLSVCQVDCNPKKPTCASQYNQMQNGYYTCVQGIDECSFGNNTNQSGSCETVCGKGGGECLATYNNVDQCGHGQPLQCGTTGFNSVICVCSRGCGTGNACSGGMKCVNGQCM